MANEMLENLTTLADKIAKDKPRATDEQKTTNWLVNPFLKTLGYSIDNGIVEPQYDVSDGKDNKVDYAIVKNNKPIVLIEIKKHTENLDKHFNQLRTYFNVCAKCSFGILTNGVEYRFFSNTENVRDMDSTPFMVLNLESEINSEMLEILELFKCENLQSKIPTIKNKAKKMLEQKEQNAICLIIKDFLEKEMKKPSDEFVGFVIDKKFNKVIKQKKQTKIKEFREYITTAFSELIADKADEIIATKEAQNAQSQDSQDNSKELSDEENQAFYIVRGILLENSGANLNNIIITPATNYVAIRLSDSSRKWICRLYLKKHINRNGYLAIPDKSDSTKEAPPLYVDSLADIYKYKNELAESLKMRLK